MPYGPHVADDRARMLATIGVASVDDLFEDIPAPLRAGPLRIDPAEPELELRRAAHRPRRAQPRRPRELPRRGRLPPLDPARRRPAAAPRRVVHGLHAVPARGQPGHAPEHLRVPVAARGADGPRRRVGLALRRRRGDGRGRADDLPGDAARPDPRLARRPSALPPDARDLRRRRGPRGRRDPAGRGGPDGRHHRPRRAGAAARRHGPAGRRASWRPSRASSGCSRTCPRSGGSRTPRGRCSSASSSPCRSRCSPRRASTARTSPRARASRWASRSSTAARTSASSPAPTPSCGRSRAASSG